MSQNLQVEVWARDDYLGVFSIEMAVKTMRVDEIIKGLEIGKSNGLRKSNGQHFRIREKTTKKTRKKSERHLRSTKKREDLKIFIERERDSKQIWKIRELLGMTGNVGSREGEFISSIISCNYLCVKQIIA